MLNNVQIQEFHSELSIIEKQINNLKEKYPFKFSIFLKKDKKDNFFFTSQIEVD